MDVFLLLAVIILVLKKIIVYLLLHTSCFYDMSNCPLVLKSLLESDILVGETVSMRSLVFVYSIGGCDLIMLQVALMYISS